MNIALLTSVITPITAVDRISRQRPDVDSRSPEDSKSIGSQSSEVKPDQVSLSNNAIVRAQGSSSYPDHNQTPDRTPDKKPPKELSSEDRDAIQKMKQRDSHVRAHEAAHLAAAGKLATGGAQYTYQKGPDGQQYASGGEVSIAVSEGDTPEERLQSAEQARRAALAPSDPSPQDRSVASEATSNAMQAQRDIAEKATAVKIRVGSDPKTENHQTRQKPDSTQPSDETRTESSDIVNRIFSRETTEENRTVSKSNSSGSKPSEGVTFEAYIVDASGRVSPAPHPEQSIAQPISSAESNVVPNNSAVVSPITVTPKEASNIAQAYSNHSIITDSITKRLTIDLFA